MRRIQVGKYGPTRRLCYNTVADQNMIRILLNLIPKWRGGPDPKLGTDLASQPCQSPITIWSSAFSINGVFQIRSLAHTSLSESNGKHCAVRTK